MNLGKISAILSGVAAAALAAACSGKLPDVDPPAYGGMLAVRAGLESLGTGTVADGSTDRINDMHACIFRNGILSEIYTDLQDSGNGYMITTGSMTGHLYMLGNTEGILDLSSLEERGITEEEWSDLTVAYQDGKPSRFFTGMVDLGSSNTGTYVLPVSMRRSVARFDLRIVSDETVSVNRIVFGNVSGESFIIPGTGSAPQGGIYSDDTYDFQEPLTGDTQGIAYMYEQMNPDLEVSIDMTVGGRQYVRKAALPYVIKRNTVYTLAILKNSVSADFEISVAEWNEGGDTGIVPDFGSHIRVDRNSSQLPEKVTVSGDGRVVTLPYTGVECVLSLDCSEELELIADSSRPFEVEHIMDDDGVTGTNVFRISKGLWRLGMKGRVIDLQFHRKGLSFSYPDDRISIVLTENPTAIDGLMSFEEGTEYDFGKYIDNEIAVLTVPGHKEVNVEFGSGEGPWIMLDRHGDGTVRIVAGWRPNDISADGRKQEARIIIQNEVDGSEREEYVIVRRNWGLPVTKVNDIWWCKYNAMGNSRNFQDQILSSDDPAAKAGKSLFDYLRDCAAEEYFRLWKWEYQADSGKGLQVADIDGIAKLDGYVHGQTVHMNTLDPKHLAPDGYEVPSFEDFGRIFHSTDYVWLMWDGSHNNSWNGGSNIQRRQRRRNDVTVGSIALTDLIYIAMYNNAESGYEPVVWYGPGTQWNDSGIKHGHYNAMLFTVYSPEKKGWYFNGAMNAYYITQNGAGNNDTRILRFRKSDVEYIY